MNNLKVSFAPATNDINDPADRMRCFEIIEELKRQGVDARVYADGQEFDILVILSHDFGRWLEVRANNPDKIIVLDLFDSVLSPSLGNKGGVERLKILAKRGVDLVAPGLTSRAKAVRLIRECDYVTVSSKLLGQEVSPYNLKWRCIPDPANLETYPEVKIHHEVEPVTIVWTGYGENVPFLGLVEKPLARLAAAYPVKVNVITSKKRQTVYRGTYDNELLVSQLRFPAKFVEWSLDTVNKSLLEGDIAIVPVPSGLAKSSNKIVTMMAVGLPVVASDNPEYRAVIQGGDTGFVAHSPEEWYRFLEKLILDPGLRQDMGRKGRQLAEKGYSLPAIGGRWKAFFEEIISVKGPRS